MMNHTKIAAFIALFLLLISCDNALNIEPENVLVEDDVFSKENLTEKALGQAYLSFFEAASGDATAIGDYTTGIAASDDFRKVYYNGEVKTDDYTVETIWEKYYKAINLCNSLIVKIPQKGTYNPAMMKQHVAEAKFLRALSYFKLLILFGQGALVGDATGLGLPLRLTPYQGYEHKLNIKRSSTNEVYAQIIKDLTGALPDLPREFNDDINSRSRATKGAVHALLSRIYLYRGADDKAAKEAQKVLDASPLYQLAPTVMNLFPLHTDQNVTVPFSKEYILGFPTGYGQLGSSGFGYLYYYKRQVWADEDFAEEYEPDDERKTKLIYQGWNAPDTPSDIRIRRTTFKYNNSNGRDNVPILRLAEVMLTRAEALASTEGINAESVSLLNKVYQRSNPDAPDYTMGDFSTKTQLINRILQERKLELAFEGHQRYDLIRTGRPLRDGTLPQDKLILPIPQVDVSVSKGIIEQNPGY